MKTHPFPYWLPVTEKPKPAGYGRMFAMTGRRAAARRRQFGLHTHQTVSRSIPLIISPHSKVGYKRMRFLDSIGCMSRAASPRSHVGPIIRRKFHDLDQAHQSPIAKQALERIGALYGIERQIRGRPPDERREVRHARARPVLDSLHVWLKEMLSKVSKKSELADAIHYALGRWTPFAPVLRRWPPGNRQQRGRTCSALCRLGPEELSVCRIQRRRRTCRRDV